MKLIATEDEINEMITSQVLAPAPNDHFILTLRNAKGVSLKEILVSTEIKKNETPSLSLFGSDDGSHNISKWLGEWRLGWRGKRVKGMGSKAQCNANMIEFFKRNPKYTAKHVFKARDIYFSSILSKDGDYGYLQQADNFIKKIKADGTVTRNMESYAEEAEINERLGAVENEEKRFSQFNNI